jgi:hypothetical protein
MKTKIAVPGSLHVGSLPDGRQVVYVGPSAGFLAPRGIRSWEKEVYVVRREDVVAVKDKLKATWPEEQVPPAKMPLTYEAARTSSLIAVQSSLVATLLELGVRVHTIGSDRPSSQFYYLAEGGGQPPVTVQGDILGMLAPALDASASNDAIEGLLSTFVQRLLAHLSGGTISEMAVELAAALPRLNNDGSGMKDRDLETFEKEAQEIAATGKGFENEARHLAERLAQASGILAKDLPLYGVAQRDAVPEAKIQVGAETLLLAPFLRWMVEGEPKKGLIPLPSTPPAAPAKSLFPTSMAAAKPAPAPAKVEAKPAPAPAAKVEPKVEAKPAPAPTPAAAKVEAKPAPAPTPAAAKVEPKVEAKPAPAPTPAAAKVEPKVEAKPAPAPTPAAAKVEAKPAPTPVIKPVTPKVEPKVEPKPAEVRPSAKVASAKPLPTSKKTVIGFPAISSADMAKVVDALDGLEMGGDAPKVATPKPVEAAPVVEAPKPVVLEEAPKSEQKSVVEVPLVAPAPVEAPAVVAEAPVVEAPKVVEKTEEKPVEVAPTKVEAPKVEEPKEEKHHDRPKSVPPPKPEDRKMTDMERAASIAPVVPEPKKSSMPLIIGALVVLGILAALFFAMKK